MILANPLWLMLNRSSPYESMLQILDDAPVDLVAEVLDGAVHGLKHNRRLVIRKLALIIKLHISFMLHVNNVFKITFGLV